MNIVMVTNTYAPHIGGVARSVTSFVAAYREMGHRVRVVAPRFDGTPEHESDIIRFPALHHLKGSDFSVPLPVPWRARRSLRRFAPDIVHSHHPFLMGDTALRISALFDIPIVFTHHTRYEEYTHYVPGDSPALKQFAIDLVTGYCNLCDAVIAPSESIRSLIRERGVTSRVEVIPTGVDLDYFASGERDSFRDELAIGPDEFVIGHVGRLAPEKNLEFLAGAVVRYLLANDDAHFLVAGTGPSSVTIRRIFERGRCSDRLHLVGLLDRDRLSDCYAAMDLFAFASRTETQGLVVTEAMAADLPVVAVDASGVREVVRDGMNGRLLEEENEDLFAEAIEWYRRLTTEELRIVHRHIEETARSLSMIATAKRTIRLYEELLESEPRRADLEKSHWAATQRRFSEEMLILGNIAHAFADTMRQTKWRSSKLAWIRSAGTRLQAWAICTLLWLLWLTWRIDDEEIEKLDALIERGEPLVACFWHGSYAPLFILLRNRDATIFSSESFRGAVIAQICHHFGYRCTLIPETGEAAYDRMLRVLSSDQIVALAVDGPLGPRHVVKRGPVRLASAASARILAVSVAASRRRVAHDRWDRQMVPLPFSRVALAVSEPIEIPAPLSGEEIDAWRGRIAHHLDQTDRRAVARASS